MDNIQNNKEMLNNLINSIFKNVEVYGECIKEFNRLYAYVDKYQYDINLDVISDLLENNDKFRKCIELIFDNNKRMIISGRINTIFSNILLISSIDVYCMLNNIEIKENDEELYRNSKDFDGLSMYYDDIKGNKVLTFDEEQSLIRKAQQGDEAAKELFIECNLKLVPGIARIYRDWGLPMQDLIQEGNIGLMIAVDRFDPNRGIKFSTYAHSWIRLCITRAINNSARIIRYPVYMVERYRKFVRIMGKLTEQLCREPTIDEIAKEMKLPIDKVKALYDIHLQPTSLDANISDESDSNLFDFIPDKNVNVEDEVLKDSLKEEIRQVLYSGILKPREIEVLKYRYGLDDYPIMTFEEIADMYGITRQRIQQIESGSLRRLEKCHDLSYFESYKDKPNAEKENAVIIDRNSLREKYIIGNINTNYLSEYKTIYQILNKYSKEKIDYVIGKLNDNEKKLVIKMFGNDFNLPYIPTLTAKEENKYNREVLPKIRRLLKAISCKNEDSNKRMEEMSRLLSEGIREKRMKEQAKETANDLLHNYVLDSNTMVILKGLKDELEPEDYSRLYELMVLSKQNSFLSTVNSLELIILFLLLGYVNNKYFMYADLTRYFEMPEEEARELIMKTLKQYHNDILNEIDEMINSSDKKLSLRK